MIIRTLHLDSFALFRFEFGQCSLQSARSSTRSWAAVYHHVLVFSFINSEYKTYFMRTSIEVIMEGGIGLISIGSK